jgi:hypothetical protein
LFLADLHASFWAGAIFDDLRRSVEHLAIKPHDAGRGAGPNVETDESHPKLDPAKARLVGRVHMDAVAPRTHRLDAIVAFAEVELGPSERFADARETIEQCTALRRHQSDHAAQHFRRAHRQVELAHADIDPHIAGAGIKERIAGEA